MDEKVTVKQAVRVAFNALPAEFHVLDLCNQVRHILHRPYVMDGTILRKLRELRSEKELDYDPDEKNHVYRKILKATQLFLF